ncbi:MAG: hypothetical protein J6Z49_05750 [Kiritimatiellae bacterium]|nr:hypothetical protein [Kiritimatiellia bacterium]
MRKRSRLIAIIAICAMMVAVCVLLSRKGDGQDEQVSVRQNDKPRTLTSSSTNANSSTNIGKSANGNYKLRQHNRTMRFLELATQFLSKESQIALQKVIDEGVGKQSDSFARFSIDYMELLGGLKRDGKLLAYYDVLIGAFKKTPNDINLLRMIAAIASIPSFNKQNEFEYYLSILAERDTNEDVIFPYAKMQLENGDARKAYALIEQTVTDHPEQALDILTNALRIFTEHKAVTEKVQVVNRLKTLTDIDPLRANWCGNTLFKDGDLNNAEYFYERGLVTSDSKSLHDMADVKLCVIKVRRGEVDSQTVDRLKNLAENASVPAVQNEAKKTLISLNIDLPNQPSNSNQPERKNK